MKTEDTDFTLNNFIVLEGIDGSGTTTQMRRLSSLLEKMGIPHMLTAEPTSRPEGSLIRRILRGELEAEPGTVAHLFAADRHQHLFGKGGIVEALRAGKIVLCDRYALSSMAYQGITCGPELPALLNAGFPAPGLTIFFRLDPETAMMRVQSRMENAQNQLEIYEKMHIQKQVSASYEAVLASAQAKGWTIAFIDAEKSIDEVTRQLLSIMAKHLRIVLEG
ncbi:MAG: dTMP kinase [Rectinemataceae bacterium]|nr:dTMP kinase [Rectinemataceae bacterium]